MNKKELIEALKQYEDDETVFVAIFFADKRAEISDIDRVDRNGDGAQLSVQSCVSSNFVSAP